MENTMENLKNKELSEQVRYILNILNDSDFEKDPQITNDLLKYKDILLAIRKGLSNNIKLGEFYQEMVDYVVDLINNPNDTNTITDSKPVDSKSITSEEGYDDFEVLDKKDILMKVLYTATAKEPWQKEMSVQGVNIILTAWYISNNYMTDSELSYEFPELEQIEELYDLQEGCMEYYGKLTPKEMVDELTKLGFNAVIE